MLNWDRLEEGAQLRLARIAAGLTLFDVGVRAGVSPPRLSEFERGRREFPAEDIARIRAVLTEATTLHAPGGKPHDRAA